MSIHVMDWVWRNAPGKGSDLLLLLAIADYAHDDGNGAWPSVETLARKTRLSERAVQYGLRHLETGGAILVHEKEGPRGANIYQVIMRGGANFAPGVQSSAESVESCTPGANSAGVQTSAEGVQENSGGGAIQRIKGVQPVAPDPSLTVREPSVDPSLRESKITQNSQNQESSENDDDQTLWPKWYSNGYAVPGWRVPLERAEAWRVEAGIPEALAEVKSYGLRDWWERLPEDSARRKKGNPWLTFQNWCRDERDAWVERNKGKPTTGYNEEERIARFRADSEEYKANWAGAAAERESVP